MNDPKTSILVTGASSGIGRAIAVRLAGDGYDVAVHYSRNRDGADLTMKLVSQVSSNSRLLQFDMSDEAETRQVKALFGPQQGVYTPENDACDCRSGVWRSQCSGISQPRHIQGPKTALFPQFGNIGDPVIPGTETTVQQYQWRCALNRGPFLPLHLPVTAGRAVQLRTTQ